MARNQRQRRPLQDDTRTNKQTVRERAQVSKRQRDRIEENRDRRERRRERERLRRQQVDSVRSPKEDVRVERFDSRLIPIEDTFLGRPVGFPKELPVVIGERWDMLGGNQTLTTSVYEDVEFDTPTWTTERNGYPALYDTSTRKFTIPGGLGGVWQITFNGLVAGLTSDAASSKCILNGTDIAYFEGESSTAQSVPLNAIFLAQEGDYLQVQVAQFSGIDRELFGSQSYTNVILHFLGK